MTTQADQLRALVEAWRQKARVANTWATNDPEEASRRYARGREEIYTQCADALDAVLLPHGQ